MSRLSAQGITVDVPAGWDVRIYLRDAVPGETTHAVLHAATFPLPGRRGDYGSGAVEAMGNDDIFAAMVEFDPAHAGDRLFAAAGVPVRLPAQSFSPSSLQRRISGQLGTQRFFHDAGRAFCLYVVLAGAAAGLADEASSFVAGISISGHRS
ncbi:MAG TPA: hypothetical protein VFD01_05245 [Candidatus Dormibacteraeota bacterium]|nr:hypothetical protein [Candidatus Dormibacteraeota bacterium]